MHYIYIHSLAAPSSGITPEFEVPNYSVPEDEGPLEVCVVIPVGQLERDQVVRLTTRAQTASGIHPLGVTLQVDVIYNSFFRIR